MNRTSNNGSIAIETHGCKLNMADSQDLARQFVSEGYRIVSLSDGPDVYVLNSCTVTHVADAKARQALRAARRKNPEMTVIATGCYAQRAPEQLRSISGVDLVAGNFEKPNIVAQLQKFQTAQTGSLAELSADSISQESLGRTRAMVKIQEGCNQVCAYCIVPKVRGRERSIPPTELVNTINERVREGFREVALTGTQLGSYGFDLTEVGGLRDLIGRILDETEIERLRVSSLQPQEISPDLLELWQNPRLCPHFHMPLQSGSDPVLRRMRRRYTAEQYHRTATTIYETIPHASVTADVIVGFPGESEEDHQRSLELCMKTTLAGMHVFPYSVRQGTSAAHMNPAVSPQEKQQRKREMLDLAAEKAADFRVQALGSVRAVLWEREALPGIVDGLTDNYLRVKACLGSSMINEISRVKLAAIGGDGMIGEAM